MWKGHLIPLVGCFEDCCQIQEFRFGKKEILTWELCEKSGPSKWIQVEELRNKGACFSKGLDKREWLLRWVPVEIYQRPLSI